MSNTLTKLKLYLNFYRIHLLSFILIPLLFAVIFWASNGRFHIRFIDALFVCISGVTGTGLSTIDLSSLTAWQQTILVILEITGNQVFVCWVVVYIRRSYFRQYLGHVISAEIERTITRRETFRTGTLPPEAGRPSNAHRLPSSTASSLNAQERKRPSGPIRPDMVRRMDIAPHPVNPMGVPTRTATMESTHNGAYSTARSPNVQLVYPDLQHRVRTRTRSVSPQRDGPYAHIHTHGEVGFGGFPGPREVLSGVSSKLFPSLHRNLQQTLTIPRTSTLVPRDQPVLRNEQPQGATRRVRYLSFTADVGKNSHFQHLTDEQALELGGVEYRALNSLLWITPLYYFGLLAISFIIITPYMTLAKWKEVFLPPEQHRIISPIWFSFFQVIGAWANTGMSLVDQNMVPFRSAYLMIIVLIICVLAGNTAFPIFFRFFIWSFSKCLPPQSRTRESLQFLLDHPRRCFIALFPSHQTWLLFFILLLMNFVLLAGDLILNIDNPATDALPAGQRVALAFLSAAAVRSAGFQGVAVSSLTPAVQILYIIMMYIAIYPIAMSVRATNVYEEKSLGLFEQEEDPEEPEEGSAQAMDTRVAIWGKYLMRHVRRQLSFDMWWLAVSLFLIAIIERDGLMNTQNATWFNVFAVLFEIVSAYGTVGLSLGIPTANFSLSGAFHTLSKLIICAVMLRGRHRGLPDALDRAVLLPHEFRKLHDEGGEPNSSAKPREESATIKSPEQGLMRRLPDLPEKEPESSSSSHTSQTVTLPDEGKTANETV